jgi:hypothetical protein
MVTATVRCHGAAREPHLWQLKFHHDRQMTARIALEPVSQCPNGPRSRAVLAFA